MIHLTFSHWWLLLPLAIVLIFIAKSADDGASGIGAGLLFVFVSIICLAVFLIVLALMVGYSFGHHG